MHGSDTDDTYKTISETHPSKPLTQARLNDLTRELCLSKESAQLLGSCLYENRLLAPETKFYWYRSREEEFRQYFRKDEDASLVYCYNVSDLIEAIGIMYDPTEWWLFIDASNTSLKAVLLYNSNKITSVPEGHSVKMTESYSNMERLLTAVKYKYHNWKICGDLKVMLVQHHYNIVLIL